DLSAITLLLYNVAELLRSTSAKSCACVKSPPPCGQTQGQTRPFRGRLKSGPQSTLTGAIERPRKVSTSGLPHRRNCQLAGPPVYESTWHPASAAAVKGVAIRMRRRTHELGTRNHKRWRITASGTGSSRLGASARVCRRATRAGISTVSKRPWQLDEATWGRKRRSWTSRVR